MSATTRHEPNCRCLLARAGPAAGRRCSPGHHPVVGGAQLGRPAPVARSADAAGPGGNSDQYTNSGGAGGGQGFEGVYGNGSPGQSA